MTRQDEREQRLARRIEEVTGISRRWDPKVFDIARQRARQRPTGHYGPLLDYIAAQGVGWGEVLGYNRFYPYPINAIVRSWMLSPTHRAVLTDRSYPWIGCGVVVNWTSGRWDYCAIVTTARLP